MSINFTREIIEIHKYSPTKDRSSKFTFHVSIVTCTIIIKGHSIAMTMNKIVYLNDKSFSQLKVPAPC